MNTVNKQELLEWLNRLPHHSGKENIINQIQSGRFDSPSDDRIRALEEIRDKGAMQGNNWFYHRASQALSTTTEPTGSTRILPYYCMECDSETHQNEHCHICGSKHVINIPDKEDTNE